MSFATVVKLLLALMAIAGLAASSHAAGLLEGFRKVPFIDEQMREDRTPEGVRVVINAPLEIDPERPNLVIVYATPNGNTIEQTLGAAMEPGMDWHFDIQHIAAQTRLLRQVNERENIVLAVVQADELSWPAWRGKHPDSGALVRALVRDISGRIPGSSRRIALTGHSGGGSFITGYLNGGDTIPDEVARIAYLDANYSYSSEEGHGDKLLAWLRGDPSRCLDVLAYDDREIRYEGKKVVGPTGGTWRATFRMVDRFHRDIPLHQSVAEDLVTFTGLGGQVSLVLDRNPKNRILHTVLVETNGFLHAMTRGTPEEGRVGAYRGERSYSKWILPGEVTFSVAGTTVFKGIPPRPAGAPGGHDFMEGLAGLPTAQREEAILAQVAAGNIPDFLRTLKSLRIRWEDRSGRRHEGLVHVMPDYLAVGSDTDFVRVPLTPMTARKVADAFDGSLITRRISDVIYADAELRLDPKPMTVDRESVATFVEHNDIIEKQRAGKALGLLTCGIKKDVVLTNRLAERPNRVAIYGWHHRNGAPIQPLTTVHVDTYVDYSHGIRFLARGCVVDGKTRDVRDVMKDPDLCPMLSDEGVMTVTSY